MNAISADLPPWINKSYIRDCVPRIPSSNGLVGQGYTVFVAVVDHPDKKTPKILRGLYAGRHLRALDAVEKATGVDDPNVVGDCIRRNAPEATLVLYGQDER